MRNCLLILILVIFSFTSASAQNKEYARKVMTHLASEKFMGRGYAHHHDSLAASYIVEKLQQNGLKPSPIGWFQPFSINSNTFPGAMQVLSGNDTLFPGIDYLVCSFSAGASGNYPLLHLQKDQELVTRDSFGGFLLMNYKDFASKKNPGCRYLRQLYENFPQPGIIRKGPAGVVYRVKKLAPYVPSTQSTDYTMLMVKKDAPIKPQDTLHLNIEQKYLKHYTTRNVIGYLPGQTDTTVFLTAHYDHVGMMGNTAYFPGAHDNASGTAMVLDLARHYAGKKPHYTMVFLLFSGEEIGLKGSLHYTGNPVFPLDKTKFVINLDLMGSGEKGITTVNGKTHSKAWHILDSLNRKHHYLHSVKARGAARNSDHWPFYNNGVPAFFIYTRGGYKEYHNIHDRADKVPLSGYNGLFRLITDFIKHLPEMHIERP